MKGDRFRNLASFLADLAATRRVMRWLIDPKLGLRAEHPELRQLLCPLQAIHFCKTGEHFPTCHGHPIGDPHLLAERYGWQGFSYEIVRAADEDLNNDFGRRVAIATGVYNPRKK